MTGAARRRGRLLGGALLLATAASACASGSTGVSTPQPLAVPLATAVEAGTGTWATVPMGHLGDPANTFWQLLFRPAGSPDWVDDSTASATATNGGLVLASSGVDLAVGVRPYDLLTYSPLISTSDDGHTWNAGLLPQGLADTPDALSIAGRAALGLVDESGSSAVLSSGAGLSTWSTLVTRTTLASSSSAQGCGLVALGAVAFQTGVPVIGGTCSKPGFVGIFSRSADGSWRARDRTVGWHVRGRHRAGIGSRRHGRR